LTDLCGIAHSAAVFELRRMEAKEETEGGVSGAPMDLGQEMAMTLLHRLGPADLNAQLDAAIDARKVAAGLPIGEEGEKAMDRWLEDCNAREKMGLPIEDHDVFVKRGAHPQPAND